MSAPAKAYPPSKTDTPSSNGTRRQAAWICLFLVAVTFAVFGRTLQHQFVDFDDNLYVYENPLVTDGLTWSGFVGAFSFHAYYWIPLTWFSHALDCQLYGLHPWGHHLSNVILHAATAVSLFLVLWRMTGALWRCALVAAIFAVHPLRVESVAWVAERKDVLSGLFFLLTLGAYLRFSRRPSPANYLLVTLLFVLGLMSKPMLVTLPLVLGLLDYWPLQRTEPIKKLALEKLPWLALSAAIVVVTIRAQGPALHSTGQFSPGYRLENAVASCAIYLAQMIWPAGLAVLYPYPHFGRPWWEIALSGLCLAGISVSVWLERRKRPWLCVGWAWYLLMLLPVLGLIQAGGQAHADRFTYLPQIGICIAAVWLGAEWPLRRVARGGIVTVALAAFMVCAWKQAGYWQNSEALWTRDLACTQDNDVAHFNLGNSLRQKGSLDEAIQQYQIALQISPNYAEARHNLGTALFKKGRVDEAIDEYRQAIRIQPDYAMAHYNLGNALLRKQRMEEAITEYKLAIQFKPDYADAQNNLGNVLFQTGRVDEAIMHYEAALQIKPGLADTRANLAAALAQTGKTAEAISQWRTVLQLNPADVEAMNALAGLLSNSNKNLR